MKLLTVTPTLAQIKEFAQTLLDTEAFNVLLSVRLQQINEDMLLSDDDRDVLKAKAEYTSLHYLIQWVEDHASKGQAHGRR